MKSVTIKHILVIVALAFLATATQLAAQHTRYKAIDIGTLGGPSTYGQGNGAVILGRVSFWLSISDFISLA